MRSAQQVVYELQVREEVGGVRQEVRGNRKGDQSEETRSHEHGHVDGVKDSLLEPRCVCEMRRANTQEETEQSAQR